jgi:uncharacterized membrane protein YdjX (TVP38/TMEM64 family)
MTKKRTARTSLAAIVAYVVLGVWLLVLVGFLIWGLVTGFELWWAFLIGIVVSAAASIILIRALPRMLRKTRKD